MYYNISFKATVAFIRKQRFENVMKLSSVLLVDSRHFVDSRELKIATYKMQLPNVDIDLCKNMDCFENDSIMIYL